MTGMAAPQAEIEYRPGVADRASASLRIVELDFTKGALVLFMLLYHWLNYFVAPEGDFYRYLRFVTPSFIFISGFFVSNVYVTKYGAANPKLPRRLARRGLKILALFIALNVIISLLLRDSYSGKILFDFSPDNLLRIFVTGNVVMDGGKAAAFYILVPISYVLLFSAMLVPVYRRFKYAFGIAGVALLLSTLLSHLTQQRSANLELTTIGVLGTICGQIPIYKVKAIAKHRLAIVTAYICYLIVITFRQVRFELLVMGVVLSVLLFLAVATLWTSGAVHQKVTLIGQYSLFAYVVQIAILQAIYRTLRHAGLEADTRLPSFLLAFALTVLSVVAVKQAREISIIADRLYRTVFS